MPKNAHLDSHACMHMHTPLLPYLHTPKHSCMHISVYLYPGTCTQASSYSKLCTYIQTLALTYTGTCAHTHILLHMCRWGEVSAISCRFFFLLDIEEGEHFGPVGVLCKLYQEGLFGKIKAARWLALLYMAAFLI